jgi:hypothetical protein
MSENDAGLKSRSRLQEIDRSRDLLPWRRAEQLTRCYLYWIPVAAFPLRVAQRTWLLHFLSRLGDLLSTKYGLRSEVFLQFKTLPPLMDPFLNTAHEFGPFHGLTRRPGSPLPKLVGEADLDDFAKGRKKFRFNDYCPDYAYWFVFKSFKKQLEVFFGHGGISAMFLKPDPAAVPPKLPIPQAVRDKFDIFKQFNVDGMVAGAYALKDSFLAKSKELFGSELANDPKFKALLFVAPLLATADFFSAPPEQIENCFKLFEVYINESPTDQGVLLATKYTIEDDLIALLHEMKEAGFEYAER